MKQFLTWIISFLLFISCIILASMGLSSVTQPTSANQRTIKTSNNFASQTNVTKKKPEAELSKEECYKIEKILWIDKRLQFTDYIDDINYNYPTYIKYCGQYPAQAAAWKPDKYWFLYNNYYLLAKDYYDLKNYENAAPYYDKAIQEFKKSKTTKLGAGIAYWEGGLSHYYLDQHQKAKEYLLNAPQDILPIMMALGEIYYMEQDFKHSLVYYQRCIDFIEGNIQRGVYYSEDLEFIQNKAQVCSERVKAIRGY